MPALRLSAPQIPELHLPEMTREDIARVIGEIRPEIDLRRLDPRRMDAPEITLPRVDLSTVDIPKAITSTIEAAGIARSSRRPRLPFVIGGLVTLGIVGFALLTSPMVRPRLTTLGTKVKQRIDEYRSTDGGEEPHAFDAAVAVPVEPSAFAEVAPDEGSPFDGATELPRGLGTDPGQVNESAAMLVGGRLRPPA